MIRVGITGGIGSGKSTLCRLFAQRGVPVYDSDAAARRLMVAGGPLAAELVRRFGPEVYRRGELDRHFLAGIVFRDPQALADLDALVHPAVLDDFERWAARHAAEDYVILESAILFESGFDRFVDRTVVVHAPVDVRVARVCARDRCDAAEVRRRIEVQADDETLRRLADCRVENSSLEALASEADRLDRQFRAENNARSPHAD